MTDETNRNQHASIPPTPEQPPAPYVGQPGQQAGPSPADPSAYYAAQPTYGQPAPQPVYAAGPAPLTQLTGGMKFGWLVVGFLLGIGGIVLAWLTNVDKCPHVKSEALKFAIIGFVIWIVLQFIFGMIVFGTISAAMYGLMNSVDMGSYNYGYHGSW